MRLLAMHRQTYPLLPDYELLKCNNDGVLIFGCPTISVFHEVLHLTSQVNHYPPNTSWGILLKEICWLRVKTESLLFLSPTPNMTLCSQCLPEQEGGGLCFPAHALSSSVPEVPIQSGAFPIPALAVGPSANHLAQTQYAQGSQRQCGRGGFNSHPSRPHPDATTLIRPPLIFPAGSDRFLL